MKKPAALTAVLAVLFGCSHLRAQKCSDLSDQKRAEILHYVKVRYSLPDVANVQLTADEPAEDTCFRKLMFSTNYPNRKFTMYLTADQRYLTSALLDLKLDPELERQRKAEENRKILLTNRSPSLGPPDSAVTIVEFSDFQCPFCRRFAEMFDSLPVREKARVRLVFRELPLQMHKWARIAAEIATCTDIAAGDEAFWKVGDFFFKHQSTITEENAATDALTFIGQHPEMNSQAVSSCLAAHQGNPIIEEDGLTAQKLGVSGTPTLFVNGVQVRGVASADALAALIDKAELDTKRASRHDGQGQ